MELLKTIASNIDLHLNAQTRELIIIYGDNRISLRFSEDGKFHLDTKLTLEGNTYKLPGEATEK